MTTTPAVHLEHLSKSYGSVRAVADVSLTIEPGEVVAFLGPNGAGKTTTIDMMLGLAKPDSGTAQVFGSEPADAISAGRISAVMQSGGLIRDLTVRETIRLTAALFPHTQPVESVMERAGITAIADRSVAKCSGGEQQRLKFALALLPEPDLLILDEPTTGMDVEGRRDFWNAIRHELFCSLRITWTRPTRMPIASCCCGTDGSSPTGVPRKSRTLHPAVPSPPQPRPSIPPRCYDCRASTRSRCAVNGSSSTAVTPTPLRDIC
jgi:ABC-type Mn2+/Zn2+ transport system ATPase subunit